MASLPHLLSKEDGPRCLCVPQVCCFQTPPPPPLSHLVQNPNHQKKFFSALPGLTAPNCKLFPGCIILKQYSFYFQSFQNSSFHVDKEGWRGLHKRVQKCISILLTLILRGLTHYSSRRLICFVYCFFNFVLQDSHTTVAVISTF